MADKSDDILPEQQASHVVSALRECARGAALAGIAIGSLELLAWVTTIPILKNIRSGQPSIGIGIACAFILSGIYLHIRHTASARFRVITPACALAVMLIGMIVLLQYALLRDFSIGELMFHGSAGLTGTPETALLFAMFGLGLLLLDTVDRHGRSPAQFLLIFVGLFALAATVGCLFAIIAPKKDAIYSPTVFPNSLTFFLLALGALVSRSDRGVARVLTTDALGSFVARRLLLAALFVPPLLCLLCYVGFYLKWYDVGFGLAVLTTLNSAVLASLILRTAEALNQTDAQRRLSENQKHELNLALQQAHAFREKVMDSAVLAVIALDREGRFTLVNKRMTEITGYSAEELVGQPFAMLLSASDRESVSARLSRTLNEGTPVYHAETRFVRKDNSAAIVAYGWSALYSEDKIVGMVGTGEDITEMKHLEEQLFQARKLESIGRLAGGVAHDFNNILTVIFGYTELLETELPSDTELSRYVNNIQTAAERAAGLTGQLLAFARRQIIEPKIVNINSLLLNLDAMLQRLIGEHIKLEMQPNPNLHTVCIDPNRFEQILINLVVNARDAMLQEGGKITVETDNVTLDEAYARQHEGVTPGEYVMLVVSDTGSGMDASVQLHIFEPFFTTKEQGRGTGLGLATVYGIVKQAGGHIWIYSEVGEGTSFKIFLPRVGESGPADIAPASTAVPLHGTETILVVEDEDAVRRLTATALRELGYNVLEAADGKAALRVQSEYHLGIDLLVTDVIMPQMSGPELAERLQAVRAGLKVLYVSGYTEHTIVNHGVLDANVNYLPKPFTMAALSLKVRETLNAK